MNNGDSIQSLGGHARAASLSDARKAEIAQKAAETRWGQKKQSLLQIPIGDGLACIPYPMSQEDFSLLIDTLNLWHRRLVRPNDSPQGDAQHSPTEGGAITMK